MRSGVPLDGPGENGYNARMGTKLVGAMKAADILGVTKVSVHRWAESGRLPVAAHTKGGHRRFREEDILALRRTMDEDSLRQAAERFLETPDGLVKRRASIALNDAFVTLRNGRGREETNLVLDAVGEIEGMPIREVLQRSRAYYQGLGSDLDRAIRDTSGHSVRKRE